MRKLILLLLVLVVGLLTFGFFRYHLEESPADRSAVVYRDTGTLAPADNVSSVPEVPARETENGTGTEPEKTMTEAVSYQVNAPEDVDTKTLLGYASSLLGTPYEYACSDPARGFDCSGFVTHVFNRFGVELPRSSSEYINVGTEVSVAEAKPGDIIVFTGTTDRDKTRPGHIGIVYENTHDLRFIHSSSGKEMAVIISPLSGRYQERFIKVVRVLE